MITTSSVSHPVIFATSSAKSSNCHEDCLQTHPSDAGPLSKINNCHEKFGSKPPHQSLWLLQLQLWRAVKARRQIRQAPKHADQCMSPVVLESGVGGLQVQDGGGSRLKGS